MGQVVDYWGMAPRYKVTLTEEERLQLETLTRHGKITAPQFIHARALLLCDAGPQGNPWKVADVAEALGITTRTVEQLAQCRRDRTERVEHPMSQSQNSKYRSDEEGSGCLEIGSEQPRRNH